MVIGYFLIFIAFIAVLVLIYELIGLIVLTIISLISMVADFWLRTNCIFIGSGDRWRLKKVKEACFIFMNKYFIINDFLDNFI